MRKLFVAVPLLLVLGACRQPGVTNVNDRIKVLIGATTVPAAGEQPIEDSIIVIAGTKIRAVGMRKDIPVPQNSDRTDLTGEWVVPTEGSRIEAGETANLLMLKHAPHGIEPAAPEDKSTRIVAGEWKIKD
jgi:hypothetical protein